MATTAPKLATQGRFHLLDPMRFLAALAVVFYHYSVYFSSAGLGGAVKASYFGYLGVPLFFIISGFVITASAHNRTGLEFAISRAARLYPAFWAGLIFTVVVSLFAGNYYNLTDLLFNASLLNDYFGIDNVDGVYWTLQVEIKFYACVFFLIVFGVFDRFKIWLSIWLALAITHYFTGQPHFLGWFISPQYSFFFIGGVCSYLLFQNKKDSYFGFIFLIAAIFSVIVADIQAIHFYPSATEADKNIVSIIIICFYLLFLALSLGKLQIKSHSGFSLLGAISYPVYLIHNNAGKDIISGLSEKIPIPMAVAITTVIVVFVSISIHIMVEKKLALKLKQVGTYLLIKNPLLNRPK